MESNQIVRFIFLTLLLVLSIAPVAAQDVRNYYNFDDVDTPIVDLANNTALRIDLGTYIRSGNVPTYNSSGNGGPASLDLDGNTFFRAYEDMDNFTEFTISTWVNFDGFNGDNQYIYARNEDGSYGIQALRLTPTNQLEFFGGEFASSVRSAEQLVIGTWYHVAVNYVENSAMSIYVNGVKQGTTPTLTINNPNVEYFIGSYFDGHETMDGKIDEFQFFNRSLSDSEISAIFLTGPVQVNFTSSGPSNTTTNTTNTTTTNTTNSSLIGGSTITTSTTLLGPVLNSTNGTVIQGPGIIIGAPGITLDCAGFSILGNGTNVGIDINGHDNVVIQNCNVSNFATGINTINAQSNTFTSNTLSNTVDIASTSGSSHAILGNGNIDISLTNTNGVVLDSTVDAYALASSQFTFQNNFGTIRFNSPVTQSGSDLGSDILINQNNVSIDSAARPGFNQPASITLNSISIVAPTVYRDGVECTTCTNVSFTAPSISFNAPGFSTYTVEEGSSLSVYDQGDLGQHTNTTLPFTFYADYRNATAPISTGSCQINVNDTNTAMSFNSASGLYIFNKTFYVPGYFPYNVTCSHSTFPSKSA